MKTILILGCDAVAWTIVHTLIQRKDPTDPVLTFLLYDPQFVSQRQHKYRLPYVGSYDTKTTLADAMMIEIQKMPIFQLSSEDILKKQEGLTGNLGSLVKTLKTNPCVYINTSRHPIDHIYITKRDYLLFVFSIRQPIPTIVALNDYYVGYIRAIDPTQGPPQPSSNPHFLWIHPQAGHHRNQIEWFTKYETMLWTTNEAQRSTLEEWFAPFESQYDPIARWVGYQATLDYSKISVDPLVLLFTDMIRLSQRTIPGKEHYDSHRNMDQMICTKACRLRILIVCPTTEDIPRLCDLFRSLKIASHKDIARVYVVCPTRETTGDPSAWGEYSSIIQLLSADDLSTMESLPSFWKQLDMCFLVKDNRVNLCPWLETLPSPTLLNRLHVFHIPTILLLWNPYTEELSSTGMIPNETKTLYTSLYDTIPEYREWMDRKQRWYTVCQEWSDGVCDTLNQCIEDYSGPGFYPSLAKLLHQTCEYVYDSSDYRINNQANRMERWKVIYEVLGKYVFCVPAWSLEVSELLEQSWLSDNREPKPIKSKTTFQNEPITREPKVPYRNPPVVKEVAVQRTASSQRSCDVACSAGTAFGGVPDRSQPYGCSLGTLPITVPYDETDDFQRAVWCYCSQESKVRLTWDSVRDQCFNQLTLMVMTYLQTNKIHQWSISLSKPPTIRDLVYDTELDTNEPVCSCVPYRFVRAGFPDYISVWNVWKINADMEKCLTVEDLQEYVSDKTEQDITIVRIRTDRPEEIVYDGHIDLMTNSLPYRLYSLHPPKRQSQYVWVIYIETEDPTEIFPPIVYSCSAQMLSK